jgi:hypothetical protein
MSCSIARPNDLRIPITIRDTPEEPLSPNIQVSRNSPLNRNYPRNFFL